MKMYKSFFTIALMILFSFTSFAQTTETVKKEVKKEVKTQELAKQGTSTPAVKKKVVKAPRKAYLNEGTIKEQFDYLMKISGRYEDKKIIRLNSLKQFEANVNDSLHLAKKNLSDSEKLTGTQKKEITSLKNELETVKAKLEKTVNSKNSTALFGVEMPISTYNTIMWVLILALLLIAGLCFFLFKRSNVITVETKETLEDVRSEFDTHRKNVLVREQKLARKLQDEVIKNKNLGL